MSDSSSAIQSVLVENRVFPPPEALVKAARISGMAGYEALCAEANKENPPVRKANGTQGF